MKRIEIDDPWITPEFSVCNALISSHNRFEPLAIYSITA